MSGLKDIKNLSELDRISNPELLDEDDLLLVENTDKEKASIKVKDLVTGIVDFAGDDLIGPTGPTGPTGPCGVEIVEEGEELDPESEAVIWIQEDEDPDFHKNINSYMQEFVKSGKEDPNELMARPDYNGMLDNTMIYFQVDDNLPNSNLSVSEAEVTIGQLLSQVNLLASRLAEYENKYVYAENSNLGNIEIPDITVVPDEIKISELDNKILEMSKDISDIKEIFINGEIDNEINDENDNEDTNIDDNTNTDNTDDIGGVEDGNN